MTIIEDKNFSRAEQAAREQITDFVRAVVGKTSTVTVDYPPEPALGHFTVPCFTLGKALGEPPAVVAGRIAAAVMPKTATLIARAQAAGPYVNFFVQPDAYAALTLPQIVKEGAAYGSANIGKGKTILVEYFSPNTNKPMTVGHVRNVCLGWSLSRLLSALGFTVVENSIYNDRGIALCKATVAYRRWGNGATPETAGMKPDHFVGQFYVRFGQEVEAHPELEQEAQECLRQWEAGDPEVRRIWRQLIDWTMDGFTETLQRMGVDHPAVRYFESEIYRHGKEVVEDGLARGVFRRHSEGYIYAPLEDEGLPEKILLRSDGTSLYITQDLYLAQLKGKHDPALSIYVVGAEQDLAFRQLFAIMQELGQTYPMHHLSYGMMRLPTGKIKSRQGIPAGAGADDLLSLLDELAVEEVRARHQKLPAVAVRERAHAIALAALKYYILSVNATTTMMFDPEKSLAFAGRTGPYLQYVHARCCSLLEKAGKTRKTKPTFTEPLEQALLVTLARFPHAVQRAATVYDPSVVSAYLYELAQTFSSFYQDVPVLQSKGATLSSRLQLVFAVKTVMARGLSLLGIPAPDAM
ncbi:MAG: arginine--tRNA ligase [bacterium]|nr:arginine--tRNA ligase [bacterium]